MSFHSDKTRLLFCNTKRHQYHDYSKYFAPVYKWQVLCHESWNKKHLKFKQDIRSSTIVMGIRMMMMMVLTILLIVPSIMAKGNYDPYTHSSSSSSLDDDQQIQHQYFHGDDVDAISNWEKLGKKKKKCEEKCRSHFRFGTKAYEICIEGCAIPKMEQIRKKCKENCSHYSSETSDHHRCVAECWLSSLFEFSVQSWSANNMVIYGIPTWMHIYISVYFLLHYYI